MTVEAGKRAQNQAARRERVIAAATTLAAAGGYDAVQMRDVAEHADVALGTLYRYFPSKDHLLIATLGEWAEQLHRRLAQKPARGDAPAERVVDVLQRASRALEREPKLTAALVTALSSADPAVAQEKQAVYDVLRAMITEAIGTGGEDTATDGVVRVLGHVWFACLVAWAGGMAEAGQMADDLTLAATLLFARRD